MKSGEFVGGIFTEALKGVSEPTRSFSTEISQEQIAVLKALQGQERQEYKGDAVDSELTTWVHTKQGDVALFYISQGKIEFYHINQCVWQR